MCCGCASQGAHRARREGRGKKGAAQGPLRELQRSRGGSSAACLARLKHHQVPSRGARWRQRRCSDTQTLACRGRRYERPATSSAAAATADLLECFLPPGAMTTAASIPRYTASRTGPGRPNRQRPRPVCALRTRPSARDESASRVDGKRRISRATQPSCRFFCFSVWCFAVECRWRALPSCPRGARAALSSEDRPRSRRRLDFLVSLPPGR